MKKHMLLIAITLFNAAHAGYAWLQKIDNQSSCTLRLIEHSQSFDVTIHTAPKTIPAHSEGFIETKGTDRSLYRNDYAVICDKQQVGIGQIYDINEGEGTTLFFKGNGISWDYSNALSIGGYTAIVWSYPAYVVVKNK